MATRVADVLRRRNSATAGRRKHARALSASELLSRQNTTAGLYPTSALLTVVTYQMMSCLLCSPTQIVNRYQTYETSMDFPCLRYFPSFGSKTRLQLRSSSGMLYTDIPLKLALDCNLTLSSPTSVKTKRQSSSRNSKCATLPPKRSVAAFRHCACHY